MKVSGPSYYHLANKARKLCKCKNISDIAELLKIPLHQLQIAHLHPPYSVFNIPKNNGGFRTIEAPAEPYMGILKQLGDYLQAAYYFVKTQAAYGYIINLKNEPTPRHIVTNAERHQHAKYLLNIDLKDFFHQISYSDVSCILTQPPFRFSEELAHQLACLTTFNGRLPMGSPTSPVLSNFGAKQMDVDLIQFAVANRFTFTRYVDDMSFSSLNEPITLHHLDTITTLIRSHKFELNEQKIKWFGPDDEKLVTGLRLGVNITIPDAFFEMLDNDLIRLKSVMEVQLITGFKESPKWVEKFVESVEGKIQFIHFVYGNKSPISIKYAKQLSEAMFPPDDLIKMNWLDFPYGFK